jgi:drug/metabolite transporter (DMT)-like permease
VPIHRRDLVPIALLGILQFGILIALLNYGLRTVPSGRAAMIFATLPVLTMLFAAALRHERLSGARSLGVLLTVLGVALATGEKAIGGTGGGEPWLGELAILGSAACGALCSVLYRPYLRKYPSLTMSALAMVASVAFLAVLAGGEGFFAAPPRFTREAWLAIAFIGIGSGLGYYLWLWALSRVSSTQVTAFLSLSPITAAILGALLLAEPLPLSVVLGLASVVLGLWLAQRRPPARAPVPIDLSEGSAR